MARTRHAVSLQAPTPEPCCSVKGKAGLEVCWPHQYQGWIVVRGKWGMRPDHVDVMTCGCVTTSLEQLKLAKCPTHAVGPMACCPEASTAPCVCMYRYQCPVHGDQHIGTHD